MTAAPPADSAATPSGLALVPLNQSLALVGGPDAPQGGVLDQAAAIHLTEAIRVCADALHTLLFRAYTGKAHLALGYRDWTSYVRDLNLSRSRSYQLLDQHRVATALTEATGVAVDAVVTEAVARDIKGRLSEVVEEVRGAVQEAHEATGGTADPAAVLRVVTATLDAARHPQSTRLNVLPSMSALRQSAEQRVGSGDIWYTPRNAVVPLLPSLPDAPARIWCPADVDGSSHIVDVLREHGYDVVCTDISLGHEQDFLTYTRDTMPLCDAIVTNCPYSIKAAFLRHAVEVLGIERIALLLPEIGLGSWAAPVLSSLGDEVGFVMLSRRIAYSEVFGRAPTSNPPYSSLWLTVGLNEPGEQIVWREVPTTA